MADLRVLLKQAVEKSLSGDQRAQAHRIVDTVCDAIDAGGDANVIKDAVLAEVNIHLEDAESTLSSAETLMTGGT